MKAVVGWRHCSRIWLAVLLVSLCFSSVLAAPEITKVGMHRHHRHPKRGLDEPQTNTGPQLQRTTSSGSFFMDRNRLAEVSDSSSSPDREDYPQQQGQQRIGRAELLRAKSAALRTKFQVWYTNIKQLGSRARSLPARVSTLKSRIKQRYTKAVAKAKAQISAIRARIWSIRRKRPSFITTFDEWEKPRTASDGISETSSSSDRLSTETFEDSAQLSSPRTSASGSSEEAFYSPESKLSNLRKSASGSSEEIFHSPDSSDRSASREARGSGTHSGVGAPTLGSHPGVFVDLRQTMWYEKGPWLDYRIAPDGIGIVRDETSESEPLVREPVISAYAQGLTTYPVHTFDLWPSGKHYLILPVLADEFHRLYRAALPRRLSDSTESDEDATHNDLSLPRAMEAVPPKVVDTSVRAEQPMSQERPQLQDAVYWPRASVSTSEHSGSFSEAETDRGDSESDLESDHSSQATKKAAPESKQSLESQRDLRDLQKWLLRSSSMPTLSPPGTSEVISSPQEPVSAQLARKDMAMLSGAMRPLADVRNQIPRLPAPMPLGPNAFSDFVDPLLRNKAVASEVDNSAPRSVVDRNAPPSVMQTVKAIEERVRRQKIESEGISSATGPRFVQATKQVADSKLRDSSPVDRLNRPIRSQSMPHTGGKGGLAHLFATTDEKASGQNSLREELYSWLPTPERIRLTSTLERAGGKSRPLSPSLFEWPSPPRVPKLRILSDEELREAFYSGRKGPLNDRKKDEPRLPPRLKKKLEKLKKLEKVKKPKKPKKPKEPETPWWEKSIPLTEPDASGNLLLTYGNKVEDVSKGLESAVHLRKRAVDVTQLRAGAQVEQEVPQVVTEEYHDYPGETIRIVRKRSTSLSNIWSSDTKPFFVRWGPVEGNHRQTMLHPGYRMDNPYSSDRPYDTVWSAGEWNRPHILRHWLDGYRFERMTASRGMIVEGPVPWYALKENFQQRLKNVFPEIEDVFNQRRQAEAVGIRFTSSSEWEEATLQDPQRTPRRIRVVTLNDGTSHFWLTDRGSRATDGPLTFLELPEHIQDFLHGRNVVRLRKRAVSLARRHLAKRVGAPIKGEA